MSNLRSLRTAPERQPTGITLFEVLVIIAIVPILAVLLPALAMSKASWLCFLYPHLPVQREGQIEER